MLHSIFVSLCNPWQDASNTKRRNWKYTK